jgi:hypothetical protein
MFVLTKLKIELNHNAHYYFCNYSKQIWLFMSINKDCLLSHINQIQAMKMTCFCCSIPINIGNDNWYQCRIFFQSFFVLFYFPILYFNLVIQCIVKKK